MPGNKVCPGSAQPFLHMSAKKKKKKKKGFHTSNL